MSSPLDSRTLVSSKTLIIKLMLYLDLQYKRQNVNTNLKVQAMLVQRFRYQCIILGNDKKSHIYASTVVKELTNFFDTISSNMAWSACS